MGHTLGAMTYRSPNPLLLSLAAATLSLRAPLASVPPLLQDIIRDTGISYAAAGLLTALPTLCMGIFALGAPLVMAGIGMVRGIFYALALIAVAVAARALAKDAMVLFIATIAMGIGIAVAQSLIPAFVRQHFAAQRALVTGLYVAAMNAAAAVAAGTAVPLAAAFHAWPAALAAPAIFAVFGLAAWLPVMRRGDRGTRNAGRSLPPLPWGESMVWLMAVFSGAGSILYYCALAWTAPIYVDLGWTPTHAGLLLTGMTVAQIAGSLVIPALANRRADRRRWLAVSLILLTIGFAGMAAAPLASPWSWAFVIGFGMGGIFPLALTLPIDFARDVEEAGRVTALMLGGGYIIAATGPFALGAIRDYQGSYSAGVASLAVISLAMLGASAWFRSRPAADGAVPGTRRIP